MLNSQGVMLFWSLFYHFSSRERQTHSFHIAFLKASFQQASRVFSVKFGKWKNLHPPWSSILIRSSSFVSTKGVLQEGALNLFPFWKAFQWNTTVNGRKKRAYSYGFSWNSLGILMVSLRIFPFFSPIDCSKLQERYIGRSSRSLPQGEHTYAVRDMCLHVTDEKHFDSYPL